MNEPSAEETIFAATLQLPPEERAAYLHQACGENAPLRQRIEVLLNASEQSGAFLEQPAAPTLRRTGAVSSPLAEKPGDRIGRYKLLQQIGEGGCGVVYMAEQEEPVHRRVALKVIKLGMDTKQVIARFEAERQALAVMDHPNIAKVLDAGATETGRPYFVMELVRGVKITEYCDQNNLPTRERLELFVQVCRAIQHAHQKGIIHRDIKPSNILVTINDGVAVPKVIDFGIAKATQGRLTDQTLFTAFEQFIGTPAYTSPEQAVMTSLDIDTRSDIYSLGVLLYELLTGETPFDGKELLVAGLDAMRRTIREKEPERPSTRLSTMLEGELRTAALHRRSEAPKLISGIRGDLDWIVMKCLEKDRTRRYETANGLASDLERHLNQEPVLACPPTKLYRFQKMVQRNKLAFASGISVAAALVIGLGVATWMFFQERAALKRAVNAEREQTRLRQQAQDEAVKSQQVARFLKDTLQAVGPAWAKGGDTTMLTEVLGRTADRVSKDLTNQPAVQAELRATIGSVYQTLDQYYQNIGDHEKAATVQRDLLSLRRTLFGATNALVADSLNELASTLYRLDLPEAETMAREALAIRRSLFGNEHESVADSLGVLANALEQPGKLAESESVHREALAIVKKVYGRDHFNVAAELNNLAGCVWRQGKLAEAETMYRETLAMWKKLKQGEHPNAATTLRCLGGVLNDEGKLVEAESTYREVLTLLKSLVGDQHPDTANALFDLGIVLSREGDLTDTASEADMARLRASATPFQLGKLAEAETTYQQALAIFRKLGNSHQEAAMHVNLGQVLQMLGKSTEAEAEYRAALPLSRKLGDGDLSPVFVAGWNLMDLLREQGKLAADGIAIYKELPETAHRLKRLFLGEWMIQVLPPEVNAIDAGKRISAALGLPAEGLSKDATFLSSRGEVLARRGHWQEATSDLTRAIALNPEDHEVWHFLAVVLVQSGQLDVYRDYCRKSVERFGKMKDPFIAERIAKDCLLLPASGADLAAVAGMAETAVRTAKQSWFIPWSQLCKGLAEYRQGHFTSAVEWMEKVLTKAGESSERDVEACMVQAMAYQRLNQPDKAHAALAKGSELVETKLVKLTAGDLGQGWVDWIIAQALVREAQALCGPDAVLAKQGKAAEAQMAPPPASATVVRKVNEGQPGVSAQVEALATTPRRETKTDEVEKPSIASPSPPAEAQTENLQTLRVRGEFFARHTRWKEGAADLTRALELSPDNHWLWHCLAAVLVQDGRLADYREHCAKSLRQFRKTVDPTTAERIAKDCLILPSSGADLQEVAKLADLAASSGTNHPNVAWFQLCKGLSEYRLGRFASAVDWVERALTKAGEAGELSVQAEMVLAMAQWQLRQIDSARTALAKGIEIANTKLPKLEDGDLGGYWIDWIIGQALLREAKALIEGQPVTAKDTAR
ncbi:MAG: tetratricopeptide repeat protein [Limisphaerales bacterium]